ncbi:luciferase-like domain-containing protein [Hypoxylon cercidicola]|nr:luciferase-like domain-containing protein [Hypoxylon cercidicola]
MASSEAKKSILLNAFDMSTVGHLSPGQWMNPVDKSATKRSLDYWIELAKLLERGGLNALFLADTYGGYDTYEGSLDNCIRLWEGSWADDAISPDPENDSYADPDKIRTINHKGKYLSLLDAFTTTSEDVPRWTPRVVAEKAAVGGLAHVAVGSPQTVADDMERWVRDGDVDGFNIGYVTTPGTFEDVVELLVPELRRRGVYADPTLERVGLTACERVYGKGQSGLRNDHPGSRYKYDRYQEEAPYEDAEAAGE